MKSLREVKPQLLTLAAGFSLGLIFMAWTGVTTAQQPAPAVVGAAGASGASGRGRGGGFRPSDPIDFNDHAGFIQIFDGTTLNNWDGKPGVWRVLRTL